jgi:manganese-dependent inorganic pyrophosphatase
MQPVWVLGHRHPDTDAVCSALAYAHFFEWQTGRPALACYLDELAPETSWLLGHLGLAAPQAASDVYLRVADVMDTHVPVLRPGQTLREAGLLMQVHAVRALPVVDAAHRLVGLVQRDTLATQYLEQLQLPEEVDLPVRVIQRVLQAELLAGSADAVLSDRVWIATMTAEKALATIGVGDGVIVGDQPAVQRAALAARAACLIVTDAAPLDPSLLAAAAQQGALVLRTHHSPFAAALLLQQCAPIDRIMARDLSATTVLPDALLRDARAQLRQHNLTGLAVIDDQRTLRGMLLRRHLTDQATRQVILTDHNHPDQAAPGVAESEIVAIIDHHNLGGLQTLKPLFVHCEPVGSTCTLIGELFRQTGAPLPPALAGAMLGAILSDTVLFRSPTTTERDRTIATWLAEQSGQQIEALARQLFRARLPVPTPPARWWVGRDAKVFAFGEARFSVSQVELTDIAQVMPPVEALQQALRDQVAEQQLRTAFVLLTDIVEESSILVAADAEGEGLASRAFGRPFVDGRLALPGVMSRKLQVIPPLALALS